MRAIWMVTSDRYLKLIKYELQKTGFFSEIEYGFKVTQFNNKVKSVTKNVCAISSVRW